MDCKELTNQIANIKDQMTRFDSLIDDRNPNEAIKIKGELTSLFETELAEYIWPFEKLIQEKLKDQYDVQKESYLAVGLIKQLPSGKIGFIEQGIEYPFPSLEEVYEYLSSDQDFVETLKTKEHQGFEEILIVPFAMDIGAMQSTIETRVKAQGGKANWYGTNDWKDQSKMGYFTELNSDGTISEGLTKEKVKEKPNFLLNGYMISLKEKNNQIPDQTSPDKDSVNGRKRIKAGKKGIDYLDLIQNPKNPEYEMYKGEDYFIPEEWFALFAQDLYQKYIKENKQIEQSGSQLLDFDRWCLFVRNKFPSGGLPGVYWGPGVRRVCLSVRDSGDSVEDLGVRSAMRKPIKI